MRKFWLVLIVFSAISATFSHAKSSVKDPSPHSEATLITDSPSKRLGFRLKMDAHWHTYWKNPGDSGLPIRFEWKLPKDIQLREREWPHPFRVETAGIVTFGYEDDLVITFDVDTTTQIPQEIALTAKWLICEKVCLPASAELKTQWIPTETSNPTNVSLFLEFEKKTPKTISGNFSATVTDDAIEWNVSSPEIKSIPKTAELFILEKSLVDHVGGLSVTKTKEGFTLKQKKSEYADTFPTALHAILKFSPFNSYWINASVTMKSAKAALTPPSEKTWLSDLGFLGALLFAFLGGILLNLMPCVLPVISIKALGLVKHSQSRIQMRASGILFLMGVLVSFWVLVGVLLALRSSGELVGWGFQLQSPLFVGALCVLMMLMSLNLLGLFEFGHSFALVSSKIQTQNPYLESFVSGVLTTLVSTPCSAPFMGSALGYALSQPMFQAFLIFTALGIGVAFPFTMVALVPGASRLLPRPGTWMDAFKKILSIPLFGTVVWLGWVFSLQASDDAFIKLIVSLTALSGAAIAYGQIRRIATRGAITLLLLIVAGVSFPWMPQPSDIPMEKHMSGIWQPYSKELLQTNLKMGKTVFVDFTAAWCLSCQVNKKLALSRPEVEEAFTRAGIVTLEADWTNESPEITEALKSLGRSGVPVYVFYRGSSIDLLPEVLTPTIILNAIERNKP